MTSLRFLVLLVLGVLLAFGSSSACGDPPEGEENTFNVTEPTNDDIEVEFVLENDTDAAVFIQQATFPSPGWLDVQRDGEAITIREDHCSLPRHCDEPGAIDCGMMPPYVDELSAGESVSLQWEGAEYVVVGDDDDPCYEEQTVDPDELLEAQFCYGYEHPDHPDGESPGDEDPGAQAPAHLEDPVCETLEFEPGSTEELVVRVQEEELPPAEESIDFVLENDTEDTIYVQAADLPEPSWLSVYRGDEQVYIMWDCGMPCPCDEDDACMVCGMPAPFVEELEPGEEKRHTWDGTEHLIIDQEDDTACHDTTVITEEMLNAEVCYGNDVVEHSDYEERIDDEVCETGEFHFGVDDEFRVVAQ